MSQLVRDVMTGDPQVVKPSSTAQQAAKIMREKDIGDVLVVDDSGLVQGILTDRDIVVRGVVTGADPKAIEVSQLFTSDPVTIGPKDSLEQAVALMRKNSVRRLPVVSNGVPVGIVSLSDVAKEQSPDSTLAHISSARPNGVGPTAKSISARRFAKVAVASLPIAAAGAGAVLVVERVSGRKPKRSIKVASKQLRRLGKQMSKTPDRIGSDSINKAAEYATRASKEMRRRGNKARRHAEKVARNAERKADGALIGGNKVARARRKVMVK
ncbi:MAG: CBS domain-containing protein [Actinomycetota bacterium]